MVGDKYNIADGAAIMLKCAVCGKTVRDGENHICRGRNTTLDDSKSVQYNTANGKFTLTTPLGNFDFDVDDTLQ